MAIARIIVTGMLGATLIAPVASTAASAAPTAATGGSISSAAYTGSWQGTTGQNRVMKFRVSSTNRVTTMTFGYRASSGGCTITATTTLKGLTARINSLHKFTVRRTVGNSAFVVKGTMTSRTKARGTLRVAITDPTGFGCSGSLSTTWRAHK